MEEKAEGIEEVIYQICRVCDKSKPLTEFYKRKTSKLGRKTICKLCEAIENAKYREEHKAETAARNKKYRETEKGLFLRRCCEQRRRALKQNSEVDNITPEEFEWIIKNQRGKCNLCGKKFCKPRPATIDHVIPLSKGGAHISSNIQALCRSCNSSKNSKIMKGFILSWPLGGRNPQYGNAEKS